ncbi:G-type lectin S-receptor-like serine/threonine-protein kinase LECRK1 [Juglans regia]|uniref:Receptor-like serine/threonine-protein kinase n=2 Tax=Juglans regia TaxID=51240 RepID=A0A2I4HTK6_JUGRE|nr:G-type lectin S-receptor-like serine/threonine-protein kinase LECRK1 [Juglans regia]
MASISVVVCLLLISFAVGRDQQNQSGHIAPGSLLSPRSDSSSWLSPTGRFAFGFYQKGRSDHDFAVGIWLVGTEENITVWTSFRDDPPLTSNALLNFNKDGKLVLMLEGVQHKFITEATDQSASYASMLDSGNFVLYDDKSNIIWQSFRYPTDTILGGQSLFRGNQLASSLNKTDHSTGRFLLMMQYDGNLVLYPANTEDSAGDAYWSSDTYSSFSPNWSLYLNYTGLLLIINGTSTSGRGSLIRRIYSPSPSGNVINNSNTIYRATLDYDGILRLYSHAYDESGNLSVQNKLWESALPCQVNNFCGLNSYCILDDNQPICVCLPGTDFLDPNKRNLGCERNFSEAESCINGKERTEFYSMKTIENMRWGDRSYVHEPPMSKEECRKSCLEDCNCGAALIALISETSGSCMKQNLPLRYVRKYTEKEFGGLTAFFKVGMKSIKSGKQSGLHPNKPRIVVPKSAIVQIILVTSAFTVFSTVSLALSCLFIFKIRILKYGRLLENGDLGPEEIITLRLFSYNELKRVTHGFKEEIGKGSFGSVYKGSLQKGKRLVAVKRLEKLIEEGEREFRAEMRAIGRTRHKNLVRLLGYCAEGSKRLLVYEFMSNGSLADLLFRSQRRPAWTERVRIALDVARGIFYLHDECGGPIIHCDIKPQNILMDEVWTAKISDFGLAKFLIPDQTRTFTGARGTRGYIAPEWHKNIPISVRVDVYSYGVVLLEIICCRRSIELDVSNDDEILLSTWIYKCFVAGELEKIVKWEEVDKTALENMVKVGLWCIQDEPALRPSMKSVVSMLEGNITDISVPPCPTAA